MSNGNGVGNGSHSSSGGGFQAPSGAPPSQVPASTQVTNPSTGQQGVADAHGGVHIYRPPSR